jgi:site-specific DNA recombinase
VTTPAYVRISSDPTGKALGVERQLEEITRWLTSRGKTLGTVYTDNDLSATTGKARPAFERLLADKPTEVVVWHQDRLLRVSKDLERVLDAGFVVHAVEAGTLDLSTPTGRAVARTVTAWSTFETEHKAQRQRAANRQRRVSGQRHGGGQRTFGYTQDGLDLVPTEAGAVRSGFAYVIAGGTLKSLAGRWNAEGFTTTFGNPWTHTAVRRLLQNPVYAGHAVYAGEVVARGRWEPIVDEPTFETVKALLADPSRKTTTGNGRRQYFLPALVTCGICGQLMASGRTSRGARTYVCHSRHLSRSAEPVDAYVTEAVLTRLETIDLAVTAPDNSSAGEAAAIRERLNGLALAYAADAITLAQMTTASDALRARLDAATAQMVTSTRDGVLRALTGDVRGQWELLDNDRRRAVVEALTERITLYSAGRGSKTFRPSTVTISWR